MTMTMIITMMTPSNRTKAAAMTIPNVAIDTPAVTHRLRLDS